MRKWLRSIFAKRDASERLSFAAAISAFMAVADDKLQLSEASFNQDGVIKLSMGRKKHVLLKAAS